MESCRTEGLAGPRDPAALRADIERAFAAGDWVVVCWEPGCPLHRLIGWSEEEWVAVPSREGYPRYTHGICPEHMKIIMEELEEIEKLLEIPTKQAEAKS